MSTSTTNNVTESINQAIETLQNALQLEGAEQWAEIQEAEKILSTLTRDLPEPDDPIYKGSGDEGGI
jgi:hypothetical protein